MKVSSKNILFIYKLFYRANLRKSFDIAFLEKKMDEKKSHPLKKCL